MTVEKVVEVAVPYEKVVHIEVPTGQLAEIRLECMGRLLHYTCFCLHAFAASVKAAAYSPSRSKCHYRFVYAS